jgi:hypothetical protein
LKLKFWDWLIFAVFFCLVFFQLRMLESVPENVLPAAEILSFFDPTTSPPHDDSQLLLFIFDFQDFSCMTCLDSFLALYRILPVRFKSSKTWGILIAKNSGAEERKMIRIAEKKLKGFVRANQIKFPILVDRSRIFGEWTEKGSCVLVFDRAKKMLCRYEFPLTSEQFEEIFLCLTG